MGGVHDGQTILRVFGGALQGAQVRGPHVHVAEGFSVVFGNVPPQAGTGPGSATRITALESGYLQVHAVARNTALVVLTTLPLAFTMVTITMRFLPAIRLFSVSSVSICRYACFSAYRYFRFSVFRRMGRFHGL